MQQGTDPIMMGGNSAEVGKNKVLIKGSHGRYLVKVIDNQVTVLRICDRGNSKNVKSFKNKMNSKYNVNLKYSK